MKQLIFSFSLLVVSSFPAQAADFSWTCSSTYTNLQQKAFVSKDECGQKGIEKIKKMGCQVLENSANCTSGHIIPLPAALNLRTTWSCHVQSNCFGKVISLGKPSGPECADKNLSIEAGDIYLLDSVLGSKKGFCIEPSENKKSVSPNNSGGAL